VTETKQLIKKLLDKNIKVFSWEIEHDGGDKVTEEMI
jgi:hypothetical protein